MTAQVSLNTNNWEMLHSIMIALESSPACVRECMSWKSSDERNEKCLGGHVGGHVGGRIM